MAGALCQFTYFGPLLPQETRLGSDGLIEKRTKLNMTRVETTAKYYKNTEWISYNRQLVPTAFLKNTTFMLADQFDLWLTIGHPTRRPALPELPRIAIQKNPLTGKDVQVYRNSGRKHSEVIKRWLKWPQKVGLFQRIAPSKITRLLVSSKSTPDTSHGHRIWETLNVLQLIVSVACKNIMFTLDLIVYTCKGQANNKSYILFQSVKLMKWQKVYKQKCCACVYINGLNAVIACLAHVFEY